MKTTRYFLEVVALFEVIYEISSFSDLFSFTVNFLNGRSPGSELLCERDSPTWRDQLAHSPLSKKEMPVNYGDFSDLSSGPRSEENLQVR